MTTKNAVTGSVQSNSSTGAASAGNSSLQSGGPPITGGSTSGGGAPVVAAKGFRLQLQQMLAGWEQVVPSGSSIPSRGGALGQGQTEGELAAYLANYTAVDAAALGLKTARNQEKAALAAAKALMVQLKEALTAFLGASSPQLARFGLKPKGARKAPTAQQLAVRVAKAKATRALRGTKGKLQKADLKSGPLQLSLSPAEGAGAASGATSAPAVGPAAPSGSPAAGK